MIAIKEITKDDVFDFNEFLKEERVKIPKLSYSNLPYPHNSILVVKNIEIDDNVHKYISIKCSNRTDIDNSTIVYSHDDLKLNYEGEILFFSGYLINKDKLYFGSEEVKSSGLSYSQVYNHYGEYVLARFKEGQIELSADYFGMSPWFYYCDGDKFVASNHYHLLLELLSRVSIDLSMDIDRSSVNLITSGFMYGSSFTKQLDIKNCYVNLPYEVIQFSNNHLSFKNTDLFKDLNNPDEWNEDLYEDYLRKSKKEIYDNTFAYCNHKNFDEVILDVSGGFDSRIVFATANTLPKKLRKKFKVHTRSSGTKDDIEKASMLTNMYGYKKVSYGVSDDADVTLKDELNLCQISRTLGFYALNTPLYLSNYKTRNRIQITGYLGEVVFGYKRVRGELQYSLGDQRLLARLGGSYLWNSVKELEHVFLTQKNIINEILDKCSYKELFKKFHVFYTLFRNRFICGSSHNIEYDNIRVTPLHSKYALKAKWMYFNKFLNNSVPDEKISLDLLSLINPLMTMIPFASENDDVISRSENLLSNFYLEVKPDQSVKVADQTFSNIDTSDSYKSKVKNTLQDLSIARQMILHIYDYSIEYHNVCLCLFKVLNELERHKDILNSSHGMEQIRKIYDVYFQICFCNR